MFKISRSADAIKDATGTGGKFISESGVYDATINFASVETSKNGANQVNFNLDYNGNNITLYGPYVTNNDGSENTIGQALINKLAIIAGMDDGDEFDIEEETHAVGRDNTEKEFAVITNFSDMPVKVHVQMAYSKYNGQIQEKRDIRAFFSESGSSAQELVNDADHGKQLALVEEKYASNVKYDDGLTEEDVQAWIAAKKSGGSTPAPSAPATKPRKTFGKR